MKRRVMAIVVMALLGLLPAVTVGQTAPGYDQGQPGDQEPTPAPMRMPMMQWMMQDMADMLKGGSMAPEQMKRMGDVMERMASMMGEMHGMMGGEAGGHHDGMMQQMMPRMMQRMAEMRRELCEIASGAPSASPAGLDSHRE